MDKKIFEITCRYHDEKTPWMILWGYIVLWEDGTFNGYAHCNAVEKKNPADEVSLIGLMAKADYNRLLPTDIIFLAVSEKMMFFKAAKTKDGLRGTFDYFGGQPIPSFSEGGVVEDIYLKEYMHTNLHEDSIRRIDGGIYNRLYRKDGRGLLIEEALKAYHQTPEYIDITKHNDSMQVKTDSPD